MRKLFVICVTFVLIMSSFLSFAGCRGFRVAGIYYGNNSYNHQVLTLAHNGTFVLERDVRSGHFMIRESLVGSFTLSGETISFEHGAIELNNGRILYDGNIALEFEGSTLFVRQTRNNINTR